MWESPLYALNLYKACTEFLGCFEHGSSFHLLIYSIYLFSELKFYYTMFYLLG